MNTELQNAIKDAERRGCEIGHAVVHGPGDTLMVYPETDGEVCSPIFLSGEQAIEFLGRIRPDMSPTEFSQLVADVVGADLTPFPLGDD